MYYRLFQISNSITSLVDPCQDGDLHQQKTKENSLATVTVVTSTQHRALQHDLSKENVAYLQVLYPRLLVEIDRVHSIINFDSVLMFLTLQITNNESKEIESGTLDLSMKKPRSPDFINSHMVHSTQSVHSSTNKNSSHTSHSSVIPVSPLQPSHLYKHPSEPAGNNYYSSHVSVIFQARIKLYNY